MPQRDRLQTSGAATRGPMPRRTIKDGDRRWYLENFPARQPAARTHAEMSASRCAHIYA
jgi:hypothetical protein